MIRSTTNDFSDTTEPAANDPRKEALRITNFRMIRDMADVTGVLDYIHSKMEIPMATREKIQAERVRSDQVRELLSLVGTLGDRGYDLFRDALLATGQPHLAKILPACGKIRFLLGNVSMLQEGVNYFSDKIRIAGTSWKAGVNVLEAYHGSKRVTAFINHEPRGSGEKRFLVKFEFNLVRQNPIREMENIIERGCTIFPDPADESNSMGYGILSYDSLTDPENGWLQNDSMLVLASLEIEKISLGERIEDSLTFVKNGVREMVLDALYESEPKVVCGVRWRIVLFRHMVEGKKYLSVNILGEEEDFNGRRYYLTRKFTLVRQSGSEPNMVDEGVRVVPNPSSGINGASDPTFIPFDQLIDPQHGWLNDNSLEVTCDFSLMQLQESDD